MKHFQAILCLIFFSLSSGASEQVSCSASHITKQSLADQIIQCELALNQDRANNIESIRQSIYLANLYRKAGDTNKSRDQLAQIYTKANTLGAEALYEVSFAQGVNSYFSRNFIGSLEYFKLAYQYANQLQDIKAIANVYNALANVAQVFTDYQSMSYLLEKSLEIYNRTNDVEGAIKVLNNLGNSYRLNNDDNKALIMYRQALINQVQQDNRLNAAHTRINMSRSLIKLNQHNKAIELLKISIQDFSKIGAIHRIIETNGLIARAYLELGNLNSTKIYLKNNQELKLQIDANHFDPESELVQADLYKAIGNFEQAKTILVDGVNKSRQQKNIEQLKRYLNTLAPLLANMQLPELSSQYWQEYSDVLAEQLRQKKDYFEKFDFVVMSEPDNNIENKQQQNSMLDLMTRPVIMLGVLLLGTIVYFLFLLKKKKFKIKHSVNKISSDEPTGSSTAISSSMPINQTISQNTTKSTPDETRQQLVELMLLATQLWEQETQLGRIELAEQSKVWKVTVDDGRLRVRAMERYLNIEKLPAKPRWRNVIRTCHYVLSKCSNTSNVREELATKLADYLNLIKQQASR